METIQNNIKLATFMNEKVDDQGMGGYDWDDLEYHCSWDWLMPVVEKVMELCSSNNPERFCHKFFIGVTSINIKMERNRVFTHIDQYYIEQTKMEAIYKAMVEFVEWYNEGRNLNQNQILGQSTII